MNTTNEHDPNPQSAIHNPQLPHVASTASYLAVWGALMVLTALTVGAAQLNLGSFNLPLALGIATVKAALVALFFMHLFYDDKFNLVILVAGMLFVIVFAALTVSDMLFRGAISQREAREIPQLIAPTPTAAPTDNASRKSK